ncbi:sigma-70 family RNA polymerase sigma factor [Sphingomonas sp. CFBP9019]|uniref:sigma-70 family RNA polymerase sigma factor n=1 Tax=Sphingomonas sp. CFBP9019 TaxID=3096532 RepID=UPI002A6A84AD|nr:sigma-70 family RNA polymerase sigma factor [Sphingomonas sp. CFBP9019]MDY1009902.1 sigma-70 family RNA polymerase sigma factor [Sphingomonas sp. CFBP9019]
MSKITAALEDAVALVIANTPAEGAPQTNRQRVHADRAFATILKLIAPRIRHFIRQYGLTQHWDDAEQCCAIGVHRAIQAYDPAKAQFTTFVNWQLRGELQGLRFRVMTDQRPSARKVSAVTVSLSAPARNTDGEDVAMESLLVDEEALDRTESAAAAYLADKTRTVLITQYLDHLRSTGMEQLRRRARAAEPRRAALPGQPRLRSALYPIDPAELAALEEKIAEHRDAIERRLGGSVREESEDAVIRERSRQLAKRAAGTIADLARAMPSFADEACAGMGAGAITSRWRRAGGATGLADHAG